MAFGELFGAFSKCCDDEFWVRFPGVLLWVLLVGTAGARGREEAAFVSFISFYMFLKRRMTMLSIY